MALDGIPGGSIHDGGRIAFGPDGKLYITTGDAGNSANAQDLRSLAGKVLRLNADGTVPSDNPFAGSPVYSYGHRNPQGLAWRPGTNELYVTEHGSSARDEVNRIQLGGNYGWPTVRGIAEDSRFIDPIVESGDDTWAPSGALFYTGSAFSVWQGSLLYTALRGEALFRLRLQSDGRAAGLPEKLCIGDRLGRLRTVVQAPDGSLYLLTNNRVRGQPTGDDDRLLHITPRSGGAAP